MVTGIPGRTYCVCSQEETYFSSQKERAQRIFNYWYYSSYSTPIRVPGECIVMIFFCACISLDTGVPIAVVSRGIDAL